MTGYKSKDLTHLLSDEAKSRKPSPLKEAFADARRPDVISLGGGLPEPALFPFDELEVLTRKPPFAAGADELITKESGIKVSVKKTADPEADTVPLSVSLQYGLTQGPVKLMDFLKKHTEIVHKPATDDWGVMLSVGNTQSWDASLRTFTNRGDTILAEQYTFSSAIECATAQGVNIVPVEMDLLGIVPEKLAELMDNWDTLHPQLPKPKLLYTIPTGQNPTGSTLSNERRQAVYKVAQKHDFVIIEDEPYYFLQMDEYKPGAPESTSSSQEHSKVEYDAFLKSLVSSYLHFDVDGRVFRLDSFSKILAPGTRTGWIVGQEKILERYLRQHEVTIQVASGFSTSIIYGMLSQWGQEGYLDWLLALRKSYTERRNVTMDAVAKHLPSEIIDYIAPTAGMFFWIKVDATKHPKYKEVKGDVLELERIIYNSGIKHGVQVIPGHWFAITSPDSKPATEKELYFRGTFSAVALEKVPQAVKLFGDALREEFGL